MSTTTTTPQAPPVYVPMLWPDSVMAILASGPSLTQTDVDYVRARVAAVIVVNSTFTLAPWADVLFANDAKWWNWNRDAVREFRGLKYAMHDSMQTWRGPADLGVQVLRNLGEGGLSLDPTGLRHGKNSGYQSINLAVLFGASRIVLLGFDLQMGARGQKHWHTDHPDGSAPPFALSLRLFPTLVKPLAEAGVTVVNCSRRTSLTCFPRQPLELALP